MDTKNTPVPNVTVPQMLTILAQAIENEPAWKYAHEALKTLIKMLPDEMDTKLETKLRLLRTIHSVNTTHPEVFAESVNRVIGYLEALKEKKETPSLTDIEEWHVVTTLDTVWGERDLSAEIHKLRERGCKGKIVVTLNP